MTNKTPTQLAASYQRQLIERNPTMSPDFAEGIANYLVIHGLNKPSKKIRTSVWLAGEQGLQEMRERVAAL